MYVRLMPAFWRIFLAGSDTLGVGVNRYSSEREGMAMFKYAGVVLDWHDDQGETLKSLLETAGRIPELVKTAQMAPKEQLFPTDFALVMQDQGHVYHKYACYDPGSAAVSTVYFLEHGDKLPTEAQKVAAACLMDACTNFDIRSPAVMSKIAQGGFVGKHLPTFSKIPGVGAALRKGEEVVRRAAIKELSGAVEGSIHGPSDAARGAVVKNVISLAKQVAPGMAAGSVAGGLGGLTHDDPRAGAARGLLAGALGGIGGRALGPGMTRAAIGGAMLGAPAGALFGGKKDREKGASRVVDVTGQSPAPVVKTAMPLGNEDYAVVTEHGRFYPIDTWDRVKLAEQYFEDEAVRMPPTIRRQYAVKLASKAAQMGYPLNEEIHYMGSEGWAPEDNIEAAICIRKTASDRDGQLFLTQIFEKRGSLGPDVYAECLHRFDVETGIDQLWGRTVPDPWESTFGIDKTAEVIWESATERLTDSQLINLAENGMRTFNAQFTDHVGSEFVKDPKGVFKSMPEPQKKIIARMAADVASSGGPATDVIG